MKMIKHQEAWKKAQKQKAEEEATEKAEMAKYLNKKHQERFQEWERARKAMTAKDQKDDNPLGHIVAVLPIVIPQTRPNWYDPHYWNVS
jgi:hypothetical protein